VTPAALLLLAAVQGASLDDFIARARTGTERYRDPQVARAAGYRPIGPDFPGMGQHWLHSGLILRDTLDAGAPPVLEYAEIGGKVTLVGVAYGKLVRAEPPPRVAGVPDDAWHFHGGTVEEESFLRSHAGLEHADTGPRIAVLHAWIWLDNPDGLFATDNWALPYARLGYAMPRGAPADAARALALAAGESGRVYVEALFRAVGRLSPDEVAAVAPLIARHQLAARTLLPEKSGDVLPATQLADCWIALQKDVRTVVRSAAAELLQAVH
jgi:hypothetical protein